MKPMTIEITFRKGQPFAAYLRLSGPQAKVVRTQESVSSSLLVDFDNAGNPLGIEILSFDATTVGRINEVLSSLGYPTLSSEELAPLRAA